MTIVVGDSTGLAAGLAGEMGARLITNSIRTFPDGESKVILSGRPSGHCVVVQSTHPPVNTNLVRAAFIIYQAAQTADSVTAVIPYMGYARQDREFLPGEVVSIGAVAGMLAGVGAQKTVTVDVHSARALERFEGAAENVSAIPDLAAHLKGMDIDNPLVVSPDMGGEGRAEQLAGILHTDSIALKKSRDRQTGAVAIIDEDADVTDRNIILIDDMISTGGSIIKATEFLRGCGCQGVFVACTHALMVGGALDNIRRAGVTQIISANTIPGETSVVDVSGTVAAALP